MDRSAFTVEAANIFRRPNTVEFYFSYVGSSKGIVFRITRDEDETHQASLPPCNVEIIEVDAIHRYNFEQILNMNESMFPADPYVFTPAQSDVDDTEILSASPSKDPSTSPMKSSSNIDSTIENDKTFQLPREDDDSEDLLKYIPYIEKLEKAEKISAELLEKEIANGEYLLKLLDEADFDEGLIKEFKTMINMTKHMNIMLFEGDQASGFKVDSRNLEAVEEIAVQMIHYFDKLGDKFDAGIDKIEEVKQHLPSLGPQVKPEHLRPALKIWNTQIMSNLACPVDCERKLFDGFANFFDAQIYHPFLQVRKMNPKHEMCAFTEHFDAINHYVEHVCATYAVLIREHNNFHTAMAAARNRVLDDLDTLLKIYDSQRTFKHLTTKMEHEGAVADAALATKTVADPPQPMPPGSGPSQQTTVEKPVHANAQVAAMDQYFKKLELREGASEQKGSEENPTDQMEDKEPAHKVSPKGKRNSKGKSGGKGKGKGKRRSK